LLGWHRHEAAEFGNRVYVGLARGWMYLVAFLDWYSRYVVAWELSDTLELPFVLHCSEAALCVAVPQIVDSDQGSHFTSERFTGRFLWAGVRICQDLDALLGVAVARFA
jgi:putative transposase